MKNGQPRDEPMSRILIAEDNPEVSEMIARICAYKGHEIAETRDAVEALSVFGSFQPHVVITDLAMPLGGGQQFVRQMRESPGGKDCPVIVISGYSGLLGESEREQLMPCTILEKPLNLEPMLQALEDALASRTPRDGEAPDGDALSATG